ncbi:MAG: hypothetical protein GY910_20980 [bacterium]|nr:hypothetical protein [bacterium]
MSVTHNDATALAVYGSAIFYYTGKVEGHLRYKEADRSFKLRFPHHR